MSTAPAPLLDPPVYASATWPIAARSAQATARWLAAVAGGILAGTLILAYCPALHGPVCLFRALFHLPCPGCGMTRSLMSVWHGRLDLSLRYHPLGLPLFALCAWMVVLAVAGGDIGAARLERLLSSRTAAIRVAVVLIAVWLVRLGFVLSGSKLFLW